MTTNKGLNQPANGSNVDTWDVPVNNNFGWIDQAFGSTTALNATSGSATLADTQYRSLVLAVSGAIAANVTYTIPSSVGGQWIVYNTTTDSAGGPWTITVASGGGGTSVVIQRSKATIIVSDGTNIRSVYAEALTTAGVTSVTATAPITSTGGATPNIALTTPVSISYGGTGLTAAGTVGNALVSDGSALVSSPRGAIPPGTSSGLKIQATSNTAVTVTASQIAIGSTTGTYTPSAISLTLGTGTSGANGLDTGTIAASTWYAVWAIYNGTTVAGLLSLSATAPTMPSGYTHKGRIGWVRTDGSSNLLRTIQYDKQAQYITSASGYPLMASGSTSSTWSAISTANYAPSTASALVVAISKLTTSSAVAAHPNNAISTSGTLATLYIGGNGNFDEPLVIQGTMLLETSNIYWLSGSSTGAFFAQGWIDNV